MCSSYELEKLSLLVINVHISSKNMNDRRNQIMKIIDECLEDLMEDH